MSQAIGNRRQGKSTTFLDLPEIHHDEAGFSALTCLYARTKDCFFNNIEINMSQTTWFDADMCAALGAILYRLGDKLNTVKLTGIRPNVSEILSKNGFLSHYGVKKISDHYGTTIAYQRFNIEDNRYFGEYIEREFISRKEMPKMSRELLKKFRKNIFEIFDNAKTHSRTRLGIFSCGQFFPHKNQLVFTLADLGVGIYENVKHIQPGISPKEAIEWAIQRRNTTKRDRVGGLGLDLIRQFVDLNQGHLRIASDSGYWCNTVPHPIELMPPFPGTVVSLEINTADEKSYVLASELTAEDIF